MGIPRRKDKGEGKRVNAKGKVVSSGAATGRKRDGDTVEALSVREPKKGQGWVDEWPAIDVSGAERATDARRNGPRRTGPRSDPQDGLLR